MPDQIQSPQHKNGRVPERYGRFWSQHKSVGFGPDTGIVGPSTGMVWFVSNKVQVQYFLYGSLCSQLININKFFPVKERCFIFVILYTDFVMVSKLKGAK